MTTTKHQKHARLSKPNYGSFGRQEWAIIGTPCGNIQQLAYQLTKALSNKFKVAYVDADHKSADVADWKVDRNSAMANGAWLEYTDKIDYHRFDTKARLNSYQYRQYFNESDVVLVNGNHFLAKKQIVVVDPKKELSLSKKLDRLTDVDLILLTEEAKRMPDYLKAHLPNIETIPTFMFSDTEKIVTFLKKELLSSIPPLYGLVLAGGKSQRMGQDKGRIDYHGKPQRIYVADMLNQLCDATYLSVRSTHNETKESYPFLVDAFFDLGPFGAITSAFKQHPNAAWLVVACDLPLLDFDTLNFLVTNRNPSSVATAFNSPSNEFPEPLISIWEPKSYPVLFQFLTQGYSCPRKVLINSDVHLLDVSDGEKLMNVNHPDEMKEVLKLIQS